MRAKEGEKRRQEPQFRKIENNLTKKHEAVELETEEEREEAHHAIE